MLKSGILMWERLINIVSIEKKMKNSQEVFSIKITLLFSPFPDGYHPEVKAYN